MSMFELFLVIHTVALAVFAVLVGGIVSYDLITGRYKDLKRK